VLVLLDIDLVLFDLPRLRVGYSNLQAPSIRVEGLMPARRELTIRQLRQMLLPHHE
jgi:hypothetical protein